MSVPHNDSPPDGMGCILFLFALIAPLIWMLDQRIDTLEAKVAEATAEIAPVK